MSTGGEGGPPPSLSPGPGESRLCRTSPLQKPVLAESRLAVGRPASGTPSACQGARLRAPALLSVLSPSLSLSLLSLSTVEGGEAAQVAAEGQPLVEVEAVDHLRADSSVIIIIIIIIIINNNHYYLVLLAEGQPLDEAEAVDRLRRAPAHTHTSGTVTARSRLDHGSITARSRH